MSHFRIRCRKCGKALEEIYCAFCEHCPNSLLVTEYRDRLFRESGAPGIWRFNWLPVHEPAFKMPGPVIYRSQGLARALGLDDLHVAYTGYTPEIGALTETCTFKEFEAAVVMENARENGVEGLVVASAGNTARSFAYLSAKACYPVIIVVPFMCWKEMWYHTDSAGVLTLVVKDGDYSDAIDLAGRVARVSGMPFEGGVKNVAKRDGLGVVLLEAVSAMGRLPAHYFQAVGSGAGAIASWEMAERFLADGRFGNSLPQLHLAQNLPFAPMYWAWKHHRRELAAKDLDSRLIEMISTRVLSSRYPAYSVQGGVYDALEACGGDFYGITNEEAREAAELFEETEGLDIVPAAAVAVASLVKAAGSLPKTDPVLLNITGGGEKLIKRERKARKVKGELVSKEISNPELEELFCQTLKRYS
ncbi:MAG: cysteate synthase [Thermoleophilia bacterium]|nr:cysteate synthase [Thermoleophilia bacterium]